MQEVLVVAAEGGGRFGRTPAGLGLMLTAVVCQLVVGLAAARPRFLSPAS